MTQTDWTEEQQCIEVAKALEAMARLPGGKLPLQQQDTHAIYEFMNGTVPERVIHLAIHHRIVFCADCDHVAGANPLSAKNPGGCDSCEDHRHSASIWSRGRLDD